MILAWVGLLVAAVLVIALMASPASATISSVTWPDDAPLNVHDNRGHDPHLRHLARILSRDSTDEAQRAVAELAEGVMQSSAITLFAGSDAARARLGPEVERFTSEPADRDHDRFLRHLGDALDQIERL